MKYTKIVPGGIYERKRGDLVERATMLGARIRGDTVEGTLFVHGFSMVLVADNGDQADGWGSWRYVGGGKPFDGYERPDVTADGVKQLNPPDGSDLEGLSYTQVIEIAKRLNVPWHKRRHADIVADIQAVGA